MRLKNAIIFGGYQKVIRHLELHPLLNL